MLCIFAHAPDDDCSHSRFFPVNLPVYSCSVNLRFPSVEVRFENVNVEAGVYVGTRGLPTLLNFAMNMTSVCSR